MARRRTPMFAAVENSLVSSGLQPDIHSLKKALWESAANAVFWNGSVRRKIPAGQAFNGISGAPIRGFGQLYNSNGGRWIWAGAGDRIVRWQFGAVDTMTTDFGTYIEDATATERPTIYDFTPYGNWMLVNAGYPGEPAKIYKPGSPGTFNQFAPGEAPVGVVKFLKVLSFIMAIGYGARGTQVGWSDANNVELFTAASDNTAGALSIDEFNTPIRSAAKLGDSVAVYSEDQMALVRYIGSPYIFGQKTTMDGIGCIGKAALASDTRVNIGFGRAGAWWTDGASARYIDEGFISNYFQDNVNWAQAAKIVVGRNDYTGCFEFHLPMHGSVNINEAWSWDPRTGGWSPVPAYSMMDERRLFDHVLYGDEVSNVLLGDFNADGAGELVLETKPIVMSTAESPHVVTMLDEVDLLLHQAVGIEYRVGCADDPNGEWRWSVWMEADAGAPALQIPAGDDDNQPLPEAPYWKLAFRSIPGQTDWQIDLQGFLFYGTQTGTKM